ncbi:Wadjet anti-phage system protein JetD domain-containing protein [Clostridium yunnanense]|uniref:Wadjet anti-phage system protein JetD domain-containing protein n=1 Tax=Clostridium yunnanense TaxID=2800325 RepID=UPI001FAB7257|nr:Wadjet anti-phage system protein JetD domain-containing protein [Clostridium yunnanense]
MRQVFSIYLGGFHNNTRRELLQKLKKSKHSKEFYYFGDIDYGGFKILRNLVEKTGINFVAYNMNLETLKQGRNYCESLTLIYRKTLEEMLEDDLLNLVAILLRYTIINNEKD